MEAKMSEPKDSIDPEIAEMLGFYRAAATRANSKQTAGSPSQQAQKTEYVPARSQRPPLCELRSVARIADRGSRRLGHSIDRRHQAR